MQTGEELISTDDICRKDAHYKNSSFYKGNGKWSNCVRNSVIC